MCACACMYVCERAAGQADAGLCGLLVFLFFVCFFFVFFFFFFFFWFFSTLVFFLVEWPDSFTDSAIIEAIAQTAHQPLCFADCIVAAPFR